jgi:hypothetical protein
MGNPCTLVFLPFPFLGSFSEEKNPQKGGNTKPKEEKCGGPWGFQ